MAPGAAPICARLSGLEGGHVDAREGGARQGRDAAAGAAVAAAVAGGPKVATRAAGASASSKGAAATIPLAIAYLATAMQELKEAGTALRHGADTAIKVGQTLCATTSAVKDTNFKDLAREGADAAAVAKFDTLVTKYHTATIMATMSDPTWTP